MVAQNIETRSVLSKDGVKLEYDVVGQGEPIVFLHGLFTGRAGFSKQHELANRWRLVLPSTRAHDGTEGRIPPDYSFRTELNDLLAVLDTEHLDYFNVVGHSSGGTLAFALARSPIPSGYKKWFSSNQRCSKFSTSPNGAKSQIPFWALLRRDAEVAIELGSMPHFSGLVVKDGEVLMITRGHRASMR